MIAEMPPIPAFLDRTNLIFTYTNLHTYDDICPYQMYRRYIVKDIPYVETAAMRFGNEVHTAFEHRVGGKKPLPVGMQQWERFAVPFDSLSVSCELKVAITAAWTPVDYWDNRNAYVRGKIDVVAQQDSTAYINDWKSGSSKYEDPFELELGALMLRVKLPHLTSIRGTYTWLKEDRISKVYDLSDFRQTAEKTSGIIRRINENRRTGQFEKRKSGLCGWCDVKDCENHYVSEKK